MMKYGRSLVFLISCLLGSTTIVQCTGDPALITLTSDSDVTSVERNKIGIHAIYDLLQVVHEGIDQIKLMLEQSESSTPTVESNPLNALCDLLMNASVDARQNGIDLSNVKLDLAKVLNQFEPLLKTLFGDKLGDFANALETEGKIKRRDRKRQQKKGVAVPRKVKRYNNTLGRTRSMYQVDLIQLAQRLALILQDVTNKKSSKFFIKPANVIAVSSPIITLIATMIDGLHSLPESANLGDIIEQYREIYDDLLQAVTPQQLFDAYFNLCTLLQSTSPFVQWVLNPDSNPVFDELIDLNMKLLGAIINAMRDLFAMDHGSGDSSDGSSSWGLNSPDSIESSSSDFCCSSDWGTFSESV